MLRGGGHPRRHVRRARDRPERRRGPGRLPAAGRRRLHRPTRRSRPAPGPHPAVGGGRLAWTGAGTVEVRAPADPAYVATLPAPGADSVAVAGGWVAWRAGDALFASPLPPATAPREVARESGLGRPALAGDRLLFHVARGTAGRIEQVALATGERTTLRRAPRALLLNPSASGSQLLYVRSTHKRQQVRIGALRRQSVRRDRALYGTVPTGRRDAGHEAGEEHHRHGHPQKLPPRPRRGVSITLWTTALTREATSSPGFGGPRQADEGDAAANPALTGRLVMQGSGGPMRRP